MRAETEARVKAFRRALALAAGERSGEPVPRLWRNDLKAFPRGCCELASQTLIKYLRDHAPKLFPYVIALQWIENGDMHGHVFVALDGDYIDLTLDQFPGHKEWTLVEPIESGGMLSAFLQKVRRLEGTITTRKVTLDVIPGNGHQLYGWLKATADSLLAAAGQEISGLTATIHRAVVMPGDALRSLPAPARLLHVLRESPEAFPLTAATYEEDTGAALDALLARKGFTAEQAKVLRAHRIRWPLMSEEAFALKKMIK